MSFSEVLAQINAGFCCALAIAALWRRPISLAQWMFSFGMLALAAESFLSALTIGALPGRQAQWQQARLKAAAFVPGFWLAFTLFYSRGDCRGVMRQWWPVLGVFFVLPLVLAFGFPEFLVSGGVGLGEASVLAIGWSGSALNLLLLVGSVLALMNLERTFRASIGTMRWRIKYMILGLAVLFGASIYSTSQVLLYSAISLSLVSIGAIALFMSCSLITFSLFRSRFSSVDVYPSHAVINSSLTILLAGCYLLAVGLLARSIGGFADDWELPLIALVLSAGLAGLGGLLLSDRLRQRMNLFVSRHFRRPAYDYRKVWSTFNEQVTSVADERDFSRQVARLISETFEVLSASIWLMDEDRRELALTASTAFAGSKDEDSQDRLANAEEIMEPITRRSYPIELDAGSHPRLEPLKRANPEHFAKGGGRVCVPLVSAGEPIGVVVLGDRVSGVAFTVEEFDLLKCMGDQIATRLRSIRLSQRLLESRELEAFQRMSAFFVHDLKNTASSLSLTLQNLPEHFDDPAFRQDALRAISKSVARVNHLIRSLGLLRQELEIDLKEMDLNDVVTATVSGLEPTGKMALVQNLGPLPKVRIDPDQMQKVVTNLVLNARDALGEDGEVRIETSQRDGWVVLSVTDNGCGMSPAFIRKFLFRPFQTTKKQGIGIGLFHCKMIVEAHWGRIEVDSQQGKGTTFRVMLPEGAQMK
jgi:putative PEP-CTERM system histidine kinase